MNLDKYKRRLLRNGSSLSEVQRNNTINYLNQTFADSPQYRIAQISHSLSKPQDLEVRIYNQKVANNHSRNSNEYQAFLLKPKTYVRIGSYIKVDHSTDGSNIRDYLVIDFNNSEEFPRITGFRINHKLRWQKDCRIIEYPCVVTDRTAYKDDVWSDKNMVLAQGQYFLYLPLCDDVKSIDIDQRFFIDGDVYRVSYINRITMQGIAILTLNKDTYDSTIDNRELQIANYVNCEKDIVISNYRKTHIENTSIQLDINYIVNGKIVDSSEYQLKFTSSDENIATVDENGLVSFLSIGNVIIEITDGEIVKQFEFIVESITSSSSIEIIGDDEIKQHMTTILTANLIQNGKSVVDDVDWSVDNNNVQIVSVDKNKCTIKGLKIGASVVTAEWNGKKDSKEIKIKSGW